jgi:hypothetical protein
LSHSIVDLESHLRGSGLGDPQLASRYT